MKKLSLAVLVPVFNEKATVLACLRRLESLAKSPLFSRVQVVVVDDGSTDGGAELARGWVRRRARARGRLRWQFVSHHAHRGKGAAVRTALALAQENVCLIQDADLEYDPADIPRLMEPFLGENADAVYGTRFQGQGGQGAHYLRHELGNRLLTWLCNLASGYKISDMETGYKAVRTQLFKSLRLVSDDFCFEPELTLRLAQRRARMVEVPIRYAGRTYAQGKKTTWKDGLRALAAIARFSWKA